MEGIPQGGDELLPGEAAATNHGDAVDARLWFDVYSELCGFKEKILNDVSTQRTHVRPQGMTEIDHDEAMMRAEYDRLRRRRDYWSSELHKRPN